MSGTSYYFKSTRCYYRDFTVKKKIIFCFFVLFVSCFFASSKIDAFAFSRMTTTGQDSIWGAMQDEIDESVEDQLGDIDFSGLDDIINNLDEDEKGLVGENSFLDIVKSFLNAENANLYDSFFPYALDTLFKNITDFLPYVTIIICLSLLTSLVLQVSSNEKNKSVSTLISTIAFSSIALVIIKIIFDLLTTASNSINLIESQMELIFPIVLTLIVALGNAVTASTFQPLLAVLSTSITKLFTVILIPVFIFSIVFGVIGNLSNNVRLEKFSKFFSSFFNYVVGIVFTIFIAFLTLQGLTVSSIDSISLKTAKFAIKSYIPILGSYLSDGVSVILASSVLIKNAVGVSGLLLLFSVVFSPLIKIIIVILLLKLTSAILEPLGDAKISNFLFSVSKSLNMLVVCLLATSFMYLISLSLLMSCSNVF